MALLVVQRGCLPSRFTAILGYVSHCATIPTSLLASSSAHVVNLFIIAGKGQCLREQEGLQSLVGYCYSQTVTWICLKRCIQITSLLNITKHPALTTDVWTDRRNRSFMGQLVLISFENPFSSVKQKANLKKRYDSTHSRRELCLQKPSAGCFSS